MAMGRKRIDGRQMSLFSVMEKVARLSEPVTGGELDVRDALRRSLNQALKACPLSRHQVAGEMSHLAGVEISKTQLDSWTAESKEGHRMPAEYLPAFCLATGSRAPLALLSEAAGAFCLPGPDALRAEIETLEVERKRIGNYLLVNWESPHPNGLRASIARLQAGKVVKP